MAAGDILLDAGGSRILDAIGFVMLDDGSGNTCCCCGCADLAAAVSSPCPVTCTPRQVRVVVSGTTPVCYLDGAGNSATVTNANIAFTMTFSSSSGVPGSGIPGWTLSEDLGASNQLDQKTYGNTTCTGTPFRPQWSASVRTQDQTAQGRGVVLQFRMGIFDNLPTSFTGQVSFNGCSGTYIISNDTLYDGATAVHPKYTTGGSATITFCP